MTVNKILVVDDEDSLRFFLTEELMSEGYEVYNAANGLEAMAFLEQNSVDLAIVDLQMPHITGLELMHAMQNLADIPELIMLTAHATLETSIEAMRLGTCDFLLKPYEFEALLRGVRIAMQRRQQKVHQKLAAQLLVSSLGLSTPLMPPPKKQPKLQLNMEGMTVSKDSEPILLTAAEFRLLTAMLKQPDHAFTFQELAELIYNQKLDLFQARDLLKSHLGRLRQKLGEEYIINVRGVGYKLKQ